MKRARSVGCLFLLAGLVGLAALFIWISLDFSLPRPELISVGSEQEYLAGQAPQFFSAESEPFYVLNLDGVLIALSARSERITRCIIRWQAVAGYFYDPCLGTRFSRAGEYQGGGPPQEMQRLPVDVQAGQVWVEVGYR